MIRPTTTKSIKGEQRDDLTSPYRYRQAVERPLAEASPNLLRGLLSTFIRALMAAEADAVCGAGNWVRSPERSNSRNG